MPVHLQVGGYGAQYFLGNVDALGHIYNHWAGLLKRNLKSYFTAVNNHWTGLLEWTTGLDYWTDLLH